MSRYRKRKTYWEDYDIDEEKKVDKKHETKPVEASNCVCKIVEQIYAAQKKVTDDDHYDTSCRSIHDLLSQGNPKKDRVAHTTIPFILYSDGSNKPFIGSGVVKCYDKGNRTSYFECIQSPIFKVKHIKVEKECCAKLELLAPIAADGSGVDCSNETGICDYFPADHPVKDFVETGICLTVDLNKFTAITCLDPITPLPKQ